MVTFPSKGHSKGIHILYDKIPKCFICFTYYQLLHLKWTFKNTCIETLFIISHTILNYASVVCQYKAIRHNQFQTIVQQAVTSGVSVRVTV